MGVRCAKSMSVYLLLTSSAASGSTSLHRRERPAIAIKEPGFSA